MAALLRSALVRYSPLIVLVVILDQITKYLASSYIDYGTSGLEVLPFFNIVHVYNHGAAFSFLADMGGWQRYLFTIIALVLIVVFAISLYKTATTKRWQCTALALFVAGAIGNVIDRVVNGYVMDFLLFYIRTDNDVYAYPAFNVADIAVCVGAFLLVVISIFSKDKK